MFMDDSILILIIFFFFKSNAKTGIANVNTMNIKVTAQSNMLAGWLETVRKHVRSVKVVSS